MVFRMKKAKKIITNFRVIILLVALVFAVVAINPSLSDRGVAIRSVSPNSSANLAGIQNPDPKVSPMSREVIESVNGRIIDDVKGFYDATSNLSLNETVRIKTNEDTYLLLAKGNYNVTTLPTQHKENVTITELRNVTSDNTTIEKEVNVTKSVLVNDTTSEFLGVQDLGLKVFDAPTTNIRKGLDLEGGTRVILEPEKQISNEDLDIIKANLKQRLNAFGLSDITVTDVGDLAGNSFVLVEIPGVNEEEVRELLNKQGKFRADVGNTTVFGGGDDIRNVCMRAQCAGIDPQYGCVQQEEGYVCRFRFSISLSQEAAQRQADATAELSIEAGQGRERYLSEPLKLYLDDKLVDSLNIGEELKGRPVREVSISGSGSGINQEEAMTNALQNMKKLQTILHTGSLPVKMNVVKVDAISPALGKEFIQNALIMALVALLAVGAIIFIRYRRMKIALPLVTSMVTEVVLLLGVAALIGWNIDLAAIAGIIIAVGTGVDDLIIITDETLSGYANQLSSWKEKLKAAFFIIMAAYLTTMVAMVPLLFAGAGLLKGFAITTIFGITIGVFITRPVYATVVEILVKE